MTEREIQIKAERIVDRSRDGVVYVFAETAISLHFKGASGGSAIIQDLASDYVRSNRKVLSVNYAKEKIGS